LDVPTIHAVGPGDIIGEYGQHAIYVPRVKAIVDAFKDFDVIHCLSPSGGGVTVLRQINATSAGRGQYGFMDRATLLRDLDRLRAHLALGERHIARQREIIAEFEQADAVEVATAMELLGSYLQWQANYLSRLKALESRLW
jgi:hypothetical protein